MHIAEQPSTKNARAHSSPFQIIKQVRPPFPRFRPSSTDVQVLTILSYLNLCNSALDDPLLYSILTKEAGLLWPTRQRSTVGAAELCFANWFVGTMCKLGKVLPVVRGDGIWQQWVDKVVGRLSAPSPDNWVHIFPEGRVHQAKDGALLRFKWGLGRMVADPEVTPIVLPIFIEGTKLLLDEKRPNPWLLSSFRGSNISIRIGEPIDFSDLVTKAKEEAKRDGKCDRIRTYKSITEQIQKKLEELRDNPDL